MEPRCASVISVVIDTTSETAALITAELTFSVTSGVGSSATTASSMADCNASPSSSTDAVAAEVSVLDPMGALISPVMLEKFLYQILFAHIFFIWSSFKPLLFGTFALESKISRLRTASLIVLIVSCSFLRSPITLQPFKGFPSFDFKCLNSSLSFPVLFPSTSIVTSGFQISVLARACARVIVAHLWRS